ncbi:hypothetical protein Lalb_Chr24g0400611 [Lupinus albus]|uniref:VQ domain-containing protein n=1 Tax=Lupinus albus TaxID=3870 RepID=A0A6A4NFP2_LUPAL|nr:hypothetical protein Lalb_Chr24g0400611 [Lupinus albus]
MASSENSATIDSWFADYIAHDAKIITNALQSSISPDDAVSSFLNLVNHDVNASAVTSSTLCCHSGSSDQESASKIGATRKVSKRKSRASKRSHTTFITADPSNLRQMVQQVIGVRFGGSEMNTMASVLKSDPQRFNGDVVGGVRLPAVAGYLPTLNTSLFLLDHHYEPRRGSKLWSHCPHYDGGWFFCYY